MLRLDKRNQAIDDLRRTKITYRNNSCSLYHLLQMPEFTLKNWKKFRKRDSP